MAELDTEKEKARKLLVFLILAGLVAGPALAVWAWLHGDWRFLLVGMLVTMHALGLRWRMSRMQAKASGSD